MIMVREIRLPLEGTILIPSRGPGDRIILRIDIYNHIIGEVTSDAIRIKSREAIWNIKVTASQLYLHCFYSAKLGAVIISIM